MNKAEQRALKAYPEDIEKFIDVNGVKSVVDNNSWQRAIFLKGYHQAEKDLELTWKDINRIEIIIKDIYRDYPHGIEVKQFGTEVLKRFKDFRERKEK